MVLMDIMRSPETLRSLTGTSQKEKTEVEPQQAAVDDKLVQKQTGVSTSEQQNQ